MGGWACLCKAFKKKLIKFENPESEREEESALSCNCGWEIETGYAVAYGLAILEAKRICLLAVGIFVEWNVIRFAGGLVPLVLNVISVSIGVPAALATVFTIHKRRQRPCFPFLKKLLNYIFGVMVFTAFFNILAILSVALYLDTGRQAIARAFNSSMMLYSEETSHKVIVDEFQFTFQCCGHTKYNDWTAFDWQKVDYASREEMYDQQRLSDELLRPMAVPFSCCSIRTMAPCFHMDLSMNVASSINEDGCADEISRIVSRSAAVTYCVSTFLVLTQILLAFFILKIARRPFPTGCPSICDCTEKCPSVCPLLESSTSCVSSTGGCSSNSEPKNSSKMKNRSNRLSTISSRSNGCCSSSSPSPPRSLYSNKSSLKNSSARTRTCSGGCGTGAARIRPSLHTEHRVPKKRCCQKRGKTFS